MNTPPGLTAYVGAAVLAATWATAALATAATEDPPPIAETPASAVEAPAPLSFTEWPTLTRDWFGAGEAMEAGGLSLKLSTTQAYQDVARGGLSTHDRAGRYAGRYDLAIETDLEKMARLKGASAYISAVGGWSEGADPESVGSLLGVNGNVMGDHSILLKEFWFNQNLLEDRVRLRIGKIDLTGGFECRKCSVAFDNNAYANSEKSQFLNCGLVNNPTIPFPGMTLGAVLLIHVTPDWYVAAAAADANGRVGVVDTAFEDPTRFFSIYETGYIAEWPSDKGHRLGTYRVGFWNDPRSKERFDETGSTNRDGGFYASLDQMLLKENDDPDDTQGLGAFARLGLADPEINPIRFFWSTGVQYQGLAPGRDADVLGFGMACSHLSDEPGAGFTAAQETVFEAYYNIEVTPWLHVSPDVQFIANPGGLHETRDATVVGVRLHITF
jgi:porin